MNGEDQIYTRIFTRKNLATGLKIPETHLYILAVLGGSDHFTKMEIENFYKANSHLNITVATNKKKYIQLTKLIRKYGHCSAESAQMQLCKLVKPYWKEKLDAAFCHAFSQYEVLYSNASSYIQIQLHAADIQNLQIAQSDSQVMINNKIKLLVQAGLINPKVLEIVHSQTFWCIPFMEDPSNTAWEISRSIREDVYKMISPNRTVSEHYQKNSAMQVRTVDQCVCDSDLNQHLTMENHNRVQSLVNFDGEILQNIKTTLDIKIFCLRYFMQQQIMLGKSIGNHEICGWVSSIIIPPQTPIPCTNPSISSINQHAQLETILFCLSLFIPLHYPLAVDKFCPVDGPIFHWCVVQAKRGASPVKLIGKSKIGLFVETCAKVCDGFAGFIDHVIDYGCESFGML